MIKMQIDLRARSMASSFEWISVEASLKRDANEPQAPCGRSTLEGPTLQVTDFGSPQDAPVRMRKVS